MQKVIGGILIISVCSFAGFCKGRELQQHLQALEELRKIFSLIRNELQYTKAPLTEVFIKISKHTNGVYQVWLKVLSEKMSELQYGTLREVWQDAVDKNLKNSQLTEVELEELREVGNGIGYIETIDLYLSKLDLCINNTREDLKSKKKLYQTLGIMCGLFLVIVLL